MALAAWDGGGWDHKKLRSKRVREEWKEQMFGSGREEGDGARGSLEGIDAPSGRILEEM